MKLKQKINVSSLLKKCDFEIFAQIGLENIMIFFHMEKIMLTQNLQEARDVFRFLFPLSVAILRGWSEIKHEKCTLKDSDKSRPGLVVCPPAYKYVNTFVASYEGFSSLRKTRYILVYIQRCVEFSVQLSITTYS